MNIDSTIFIGFLIATIVIGLKSSRGTTTIEQYAIGDRNFSTSTIVATIVATWISGSFFYYNISETYNKGLNFIWIAVLGNFLCLFFIGYIFTPRMGEFLGKLSIAEAMGSLFGKRIRIITSIASFIGTSGIIAMQLKLAGLIFEYAINIPSSYGILIATIIVTLYSALGGIKSVTFTDIIQFLTFAVAIPLSVYALLTSIDNADIVINNLKTNPLFDYKEVFNFSNPLALKYLFLFLFFIIPGFSPQYFQRIAIAKTTKQASQSFIIAAVVCLILTIMINWIGILMLSINPTLDANDAVKYVIFNSSYLGLKGIMLAGVMAMIMSTVDSCINSGAVILVHDFFKPLKLSFVKNEIFSARIVSLLMGASSLILSLREGSLLEVLVITYSFYVPIVSAPFLLAVLGFRSTEKSVLIGMTAGLTTVILWDYVLKIQLINSVFVGMVGNFIFLIGSHYLLKQSGGWVGIKDSATLIALQAERKTKWKTLIRSIRTFNLLETCRRNAPKGDGLYSILGFFVMISAFSSTHTLARECQIEYAYLIDIFYPVTLISSAVLISYPLWLPKWKEFRIEGVVWNIIMFFVLICFSFLMVLISNFSGIQLMVFMVNLIILSSIVTWNWALLNIMLGVSTTSFLYYQYIQTATSTNLSSSEFKIVYLLLMMISTLVIFLKPKQDHQELTEEKNNHLTGRITSQEKQLREALALKGEFIRNISHEYHAPMTGITSMAEVLLEGYSKFTDQQRVMAIETIVHSSRRLDIFDSNISSLAALSKAGYKLNLKPVNLSKLLNKRIEICRKIYEEAKDDHEFILNIGEKIVIDLDEDYFMQMLDNLIINAITYCPKGKITIHLKQNGNQIVFTIQDEGIGIPIDELGDIFSEFIVSSKTRTPAGGRGVGLALCKRVIEVHGGEIKAESDGVKGAKFSFTLKL